jgi:hypothetical protein
MLRACNDDAIKQSILDSENKEASRIREEASNMAKEITEQIFYKPKNKAYPRSCMVYLSYPNAEKAWKIVSDDIEADPPWKNYNIVVKQHYGNPELSGSSNYKTVTITVNDPLLKK